MASKLEASSIEIGVVAKANYHYVFSRSSECMCVRSNVRISVEVVEVFVSEANQLEQEDIIKNLR